MFWEAIPHKLIEAGSGVSLIWHEGRLYTPWLGTCVSASCFPSPSGVNSWFGAGDKPQRYIFLPPLSGVNSWFGAGDKPQHYIFLPPLSAVNSRDGEFRLTGCGDSTSRLTGAWIVVQIAYIALMLNNLPMHTNPCCRREPAGRLTATFIT